MPPWAHFESSACFRRCQHKRAFYGEACQKIPVTTALRPAPHLSAWSSRLKTVRNLFICRVVISDSKRTGMNEREEGKVADHDLDVADYNVKVQAREDFLDLTDVMDARWPIEEPPWRFRYPTNSTAMKHAR